MVLDQKLFDVQGRYVVAEDEEARWLVGDEVPRPAQRPRNAPGSSRPDVMRDLQQRLRAWEAEVDAHEKQVLIR